MRLCSYGEIAHRSLYMPNSAEHFARPNVTSVWLPHGSQARFAAFLRDLLRGAPVFEVEHVQASSGALAVGVDFIGRLESFERDWRRLARTLQLPANVTFNTSLGAHNSSADDEGDRAAAASYLRHNGAALAAVCLILLPDFACLGYALPAGCAAEVARFAAEWPTR